MNPEAGKRYVTRCGALTPALTPKRFLSDDVLVAFDDGMFCGWDAATGRIVMVGFVGPTRNNAVELRGGSPFPLDLAAEAGLLALTDEDARVRFTRKLREMLFACMEIGLDRRRSGSDLSLKASLN